MELTLTESLQIIAILGVVGAVIYGIIRGVYYILDIKTRRNEEYTASFNTIIAQLSADNPSSQLSAAILLRRFLIVKGKKAKGV